MMRTSVTGISNRARHDRLNPRRKASGFSLLEILVVVFIIGVLATMFTLSVGITGGDQEIERELDRLQALLQLASEEATLQGHELGLRFYRGGYEFAAYEELFEDYPDPNPEGVVEQPEWTILRQDAVLGPRQMPEDIEIELEIDGRVIILDDEEQEDNDTDADEETDYRPQVFIFSSGEISPFVVRLRRSFENTSVILEVKADGMIELDRGEQ